MTYGIQHGEKGRFEDHGFTAMRGRIVGFEESKHSVVFCWYDFPIGNCWPNYPKQQVVNVVRGFSTSDSDHLDRPAAKPPRRGFKVAGRGYRLRNPGCCYPAETFPTFHCCMPIVSYFGTGMPEFLSVCRSWFYFAVCTQVSLMAKKSARNPRPPVMFSTIGIVRPQLQYKHKAPQMELAHSLFH